MLQRLTELDEQYRITASARDPVELDQESVGRLSLIDAPQMQAMAMAQDRRRKAGRNDVSATMRRIDQSEFGYAMPHVQFGMGHMSIYCEAKVCRGK